MKFLEKNLEDIIFETDKRILNSRGLPIRGRRFRQVKLKDYGIADLITVFSDDPDGIDYEIGVYELKRDRIDASTFWQAVRYARACFAISHQKCRYITVNIFLIGDNIDTGSSFCFLSSVFSNVFLINYTYGVDGIHFNVQNGYEIRGCFDDKRPRFKFRKSRTN